MYSTPSSSPATQSSSSNMLLPLDPGLCARTTRVLSSSSTNNHHVEPSHAWKYCNTKLLQIQICSLPSSIVYGIV